MSFAEPGLSRRELLRRTGMGLGSLALAGLMSESARAESRDALAPKPPPMPGRAKRVVHLFMNGGPSHVDTFDPKPALKKYEGQPPPGGSPVTENKTGGAFPSPWAFRKYGQSGIEVSDLYPCVGRCIDDIAVIRSMHVDIPSHEPSLLLMNCGLTGFTSRPSMGSWVTYGLGTENQNLPAFVVMCPGGYPLQESLNWQSAFLPAAYQGTYIDSNHTRIEKLIEYIQNGRIPPAEQRRQLDLLKDLNGFHQQERNDPQLDARIQSFELAYRMQMEAADAFDVTKEPKCVQELYGPGVHARQLLIARRLLERGVRFVQLWSGGGQPWDNHDDIGVHQKLAGQWDRPTAALLWDLKARGMLDDTLVLWGGEFGRTPTVELSLDNKAKKGRDHNHLGFSMWVAGGGVKGGTVYGATDEFGFRAVENKVHVHDLHATLLHLLGFDHEKLTYRYAGRDFRLTDVHGRVIKDLIA